MFCGPETAKKGGRGILQYIFRLVSLLVNSNSLSQEISAVAQTN